MMQRNNDDKYVWKQGDVVWRDANGNVIDLNELDDEDELDEQQNREEVQK